MLLKTIILFSLSASNVVAADYAEMSRRAIGLRMEVETLSRQHESLQRKHQSELEALWSRRAELQSQLRKESLRSVQLKEKTRLAKLRVAPKRAATPAELRVLRAWLEELEDWVGTTSMPFRRTARGEELDALKKKFDRGDSPELLAGELWSFTERELRQSRANGVEILDLEIDGRSKKSEVARMGWMQMVFLTADGESGYARKEPGGWTLVKSRTADEGAAVKRLIAKLKEGRGTGLFEVPSPMGEVAP